MKLITSEFKTHMATQFIESMNEPQNTIYYIGAHRSTSFPSDIAPPEPQTNLNERFYSLYDELIFGKRIATADVAHMIRNTVWTSGTIYDMYDDRTNDLESKNFYVVSDEASSYHVFKCLYNNGGIPSTSKPKRSETNPEDELYITSDGYQWKYLYTIGASEYSKFATNDYVPVFVDQRVVNSAVDGSLNVIVVETAGSQYRSYATGNIRDSVIAGNNLIFSIESSNMTLSSNDSFYDNCSIYLSSGPGDGQIRTIVDYFTSAGERRILINEPFDITPTSATNFIIAPRVLISGDGQGATARAEIDANTGGIRDIIVINSGSGYTFANVQIIGNTGLSSATTTASAQARAIISPPGGHGSDNVNELFGTRVGISVDFNKSEANTIPTSNDYRKISIIKDPLFKEADFVLSTSGSVFTPGETVYQVSTAAEGKVLGAAANTITLGMIRGFFSTSNTTPTTQVVGATSGTAANIISIDRSFTTIDQRNIYTAELLDPGLNPNGFALDELVIQTGLNANFNQIIRLVVSGSAYTFVDGEVVKQGPANAPTASGVVLARTDTVLTIANVVGFFAVGSEVYGATSATPLNVLTVDSTFEANGIANIHQLDQVSNTVLTIAVTNQQGAFLLSDDQTNTINTFKGQTTQAIAKLTGLNRSKPKLADGSGKIMYVENFVPISRSDNQTERIKLIVEF
jgi:hypothetical protein